MQQDETRRLQTAAARFFHKQRKPAILNEDDKLKVSGRQKGESQDVEFTYEVSYQPGSVSAHVRADQVTNSRSGIVLRKTDWDGTPLAGAEFVLQEDAAESGSSS